MNFKTLAVAAALVAAGTANAAISTFNTSAASVAGNGSLVLLMLDSTGDATQSLTVDLGLNFSDFVNNGRFSKSGTSIIWNLANNTVTGETRPDLSIAGTPISFAGSNNWSTQLATFKGLSDAAETKFAVISGSQKNSTAVGFLTTAPVDDTSDAVPTGDVANFASVNRDLIGKVATKGTIASADNGAYSAAATDVSYVGSAYDSTDGLGWLGNSAWSTWGDLGTSLHFKQVNANGTATDLGQMNSQGFMDVGTFTLQGDTLTYTVGVPEPESYALAIVGLLGMAAVARRRAAK
jgi:hypothetical protein